MLRLLFIFSFLILSDSTLFAQGDFFEEANKRIEQHRKADICVRVVDRRGKAIKDASVSVTMKRHDFRWGTAVVANRINSNTPEDQIYKQKLLENFNSVALENDLKWPAWEGFWGPYLGWNQAETALDWLDANNLPSRGHYAAWGTLSGVEAYGPENGSGDVDEIRDPLFAHIADKLMTVGNRVTEWDVINHPVGWGPDTYEQTLGSNIYVDIMNHARSVAPAGMEMWMNEDNILNGGDVADNYERILWQLISAGASPDGIGIQGHFKTEWGRNQESTPENIYQQLDRFANIINRTQLTEFDIDVSVTDSEGNLVYDQAEHARLMREYLIAAFSHESLEGITMWGFWEDAHWLPEAALFDSDWTEREALTAYRDLVYGQWWTEEQGLTNSRGQFNIRGFKGDYEIVVEHNNQRITKSFNTSAGTASFVVKTAKPSPIAFIRSVFRRWLRKLSRFGSYRASILWRLLYSWR